MAERRYSQILCACYAAMPSRLHGRFITTKLFHTSDR